MEFGGSNIPEFIDVVDGELHHADQSTAATPNTAAVPTPEKKTLNMFVASFCALIAVYSGVENGIGPCALTTMEEQLNASTTATTAALSMAEVAKLIGSLVFGYVGGSVHKPVYIVLGFFLWSGGAAIAGVAPHIALVGVGYLLIGSGYSALIVLSPAVINEMIPNPKEKAKVPFYLGIEYTFSSIGVVIGFVICGLLVSQWRLLYLLAPIFLVPAVVLVIAAHNRYLNWRHENAQSPRGQSGAQKKVGNVKDFLEAMKGADVQRPSWRTSLKLLWRNKTAFYTMLSQTAQFFYLGAFINLIPKFVEDGLGQSKATSSYVLAGTIPAVCIGIFLGGYLCKRFNWNLQQQLKFCVATNIATIPCMFMFLNTSLAPFVVLVVPSMMAVFLPSSPSVTLLAICAEHHHDILTATGEADDEESFPSSVMVSAFQGVSSCSSRLFGSIPGPIVLGALIDYGGPTLPLYGAYMVVGLAGSVTCTTFAILAYREGVLFVDHHKQCTSPRTTTRSPNHIKGTTPLMSPRGRREQPDAIEMTTTTTLTESAQL